MALFADGDRSVLAVNNEYVNLGIAFANRGSGKPETADDVRKCKAGHGVSVIEIAQADGAWGIVQDSPYNRRITPDTPMEITGPARGHDMMKTAADPAGTTALGTWNNCGNGRTPWGTYLACEENFNGYFSSSDPDFALPAGFKRYGIKAEDRGYAWAMTDERFDISRHPNEPNRAGYVVEIDPLDPASTPKKRTALGRFKHENAELTLAADGRVVVYLGDDERGEFLYRFVSDGVYTEGGDNADLLGSGSLSVARFADDGSGAWLALTPETTGMASQAEISIHTRQAASAVGATTMDRPEWVAANPHKAEAYCCLTNNRNRGVKPNAGGDLTPVGGPNPREANKYGQIVRWAPDGGDHAADTFAWDLYVIAGNPTVHADARAGSANVNAGQHVQLARRHRLRQPGPPLDPDRRQVLQRGRFRRPGQQHDAARRSRHRRDSPLPRRPARMRGHRHRLERRPQDHVRRHPAPRREGRQPLPRGRRRRAALIRGGDYPRRRRPHRLTDRCAVSGPPLTGRPHPTAPSLVSRIPRHDLAHRRPRPPRYIIVTYKYKNKTVLEYMDLRAYLSLVAA